MRKRFFKFVKRLSALALVFILCIENFAAVVSDNDGSAFITKAEFDSLKNNFQSQIDQYNTSIDSKIDTAIASYLAGIKIDKTVKYNTIHSDWENIEFINYEIIPDFIVPNYTWTVTAAWWTTYNNWDKKAAVVGGLKEFTRSWGDDEYNVRPLANIIYGKESDYESSTFGGCTVAWGGCATRWVESWSFNKYGYGNCYNMTGSNGYRVYMQHPFVFGTSGYIKNKTIDQLLPIKPRFQDNSEGDWKIAPRNSSNNREDLDYANKEGYFNFTVILDQIADGRKKYRDHIFVDNGNTTSFWLSNDKFINTLNYCNHQTITETMAGNVSGATTFINGERVTFYRGNSEGATEYNAGYIGTLAWEHGNDKLPLIGLLPRQYQANEIYQEAYAVDSSGNFNTRNVTWGDATIYDADQLTLQNGLEVCIAEKNKTYEWEMQFDSITLSGTSGTRTNQNEVDIYLSLVPFNDGTSTTKLIRWKQGDVTKDYMTTSDRKAKLKWTINDEKAMVYMKCVPHWESTDTQNELYTIVMDTKNSKEISVTKQE